MNVLNVLAVYMKQEKNKINVDFFTVYLNEYKPF